MIKVKIIRKPLREELLDEAKEDDSFKKYWGGNENLQRSFRYLINWIYGRKASSAAGFGAPTAQQIMAKYKEEGSNFAPQRQNRIRFLEWATNMHQIGYEIKEIVDSLVIFEKYQNQLVDKDIKGYQSPPHLINAYKTDVVGKRVGKARKERGKSEQRADEDDRTVIYEDEHLFVVRPHHVEASCHYGRKTKWCIAQKEKDQRTGEIEYNTYFDDYTENEGKVFYFIKDDRRKPDDQYAKVAIQVGLAQRFQEDGYKVVINGYWDRYDNEDLPIQNRVPKPISELDKFFGDEIKKAMQAIEEHAMENPPEIGESAKLRELDEEIYSGAFNGVGPLVFSSDTETYEDGTTMMLNVQFNDYMNLDEIFDGEYSASEIEAAFDQLEGGLDDELTDFILNLSWPLDLEGETFGMDVFTIAGGRIVIQFYYETKYFEDSGEARRYISNALDDHEDLTPIWESVKEYLEEFLGDYFQSENVEAIRDMAGTISSLNNKLKNLDVVYDEDDIEITVMQREPYKLPIKIKSFNLPTQGYGEENSVLQLVDLYTGKIKRIMLPFENILASSLREVLDMIAQGMSKQTQLKFKGFEPQEIIKLDPKDVVVSVSKPSAKSIVGKAPTPPEVRSTTGFSLTRRDDVEQVSNSPQYIIALDRALDLVYEKAFEKFDIDSANKQIAELYQELFVDNERIKNIKMDKGLEPETYTESKKRIKVRLIK